MDHTRHIGIFAPLEGRITFIGCGGIGSASVFGVAKMLDGELDLFDGDDVEEINIATQYHNTVNIGMNKAVALAESVHHQSDSCIVRGHAMYFPNPDFPYRTSEFVISGVDSIKSRKHIWYALIDKTWRWYLDARMSAEKFQLYTVDHRDCDWYDEMLSSQDDNDIPEIACTAKATVYTASFAAGHIGKTLRLISTGRTPPKFLEHDIIMERITVAYGFEGRQEAISHS